MALNTDTSSLVLAIFYIIFISIANPANVLILLAMCIDKKIQTPTNLLVSNLSVASLAIGIIRIPIKIYELLNPKADFVLATSIDFCRFQQILPAASVLCISVTLTTICVDRYIAIMFPMKRHWKMTKKRAYIFLPISWIVSFACFGGYASYAVLHTFPNNITRCLPSYPRSPLDSTAKIGDRSIDLVVSHISLWATFIPIAFLIPSIIMATLYSIMVRHLWSIKGPSDTTSTIGNMDAIRRLRQKRRVIKLLITCCTIFLVTNLPYYVIFLLLDLRIWNMPRNIVTNTANILTLINLSAIVYNPIIYGYCNKSIKISVINLLRRATGLKVIRDKTAITTQTVCPSKKHTTYRTEVYSKNTPNDRNEPHRTNRNNCITNNQTKILPTKHNDCRSTVHFIDSKSTDASSSASWSPPLSTKKLIHTVV